MTCKNLHARSSKTIGRRGVKEEEKANDTVRGEKRQMRYVVIKGRIEIEGGQKGGRGGGCEQPNSRGRRSGEKKGVGDREKIRGTGHSGNP